MPKPTMLSSSQNGLAVKVYRGAGSALLVMDLEKDKTENLAGFAIQCTPPGKAPFFLLNRLNFDTGVHAGTSPANRQWTPSNLAPFQKFRWSHFLSEEVTGSAVYTYAVTAMYYVKSGLEKGATASVAIDLGPDPFDKFDVGFTRGYLSSQAYAEKFKNAPFRPKDKSIDFDTTPYQEQYRWLGGRAREMVFSFLEEALNDPDATVDLFAYDLDEPDFVRGLQKLGTRLRAVLDDADLHTKPGALEIQAKGLLLKSAGPANIAIGHFKRFAHDKVMILKKGGKPVKVLTGSANFSLRGLYVQANNLLLFDEPTVAQKYEDAFQTAFTQMNKFTSSSSASQWFEFSLQETPPFSVAFSPHKSSDLSLAPVAKAIADAQVSVLFAVMDLGGSGDVLQSLQNLGERDKIFGYGVTQNDKGLNLFKPGVKNGEFAAFSYLKDKVPENFREEWNGGPGQVIHNKFVVVDFNGADPIVFTGSSNLAAGGEESNGDNLLAIRDRDIATLYAVEAIRLVDHYHFRFALKNATDIKPLTLAPPGTTWWADYYNPAHPKCREREAFSKND